MGVVTAAAHVTYRKKSSDAGIHEASGVHSAAVGLRVFLTQHGGSVSRFAEDGRRFTSSTTWFNNSSTDSPTSTSDTLATQGSADTEITLSEGAEE